MPREPLSFSRATHVARTTFANWSGDQATSISAALAFYCAFSIAPLLVIVVTFLAWLVGAEVADAHISGQLQLLFGQSTADMIVQAMHSARQEQGIWATIVSIITLIVGATTVFSALETALEQIWGVKKNGPAGWRGFVRTRIVSFGFILAVGFLLLVSLTLTTAMAGLRDWVGNRYGGLIGMLGVLELVLSTALGTGLIALIYRYLPATRLAWRHVLIGALATTLLLQVGRWGIGLYLGRSTQPTSFGAAASFAALLLWLYYSAQIFLLGAEFTAVIGGTRVAQEKERERERAAARDRGSDENPARAKPRRHADLRPSEPADASAPPRQA
jgi:membrane protein